MLNTKDIMETITMIQEKNLIYTIYVGIFPLTAATVNRKPAKDL